MNIRGSSSVIVPVRGLQLSCKVHNVMYQVLTWNVELFSRVSLFSVSYGLNTRKWYYCACFNYRIQLYKWTGRNETRHITLLLYASLVGPIHSTWGFRIRWLQTRSSFYMLCTPDARRIERVISSSRISGDTVVEHALLPFWRLKFTYE